MKKIYFLSVFALTSLLAKTQPVTTSPNDLNPNAAVITFESETIDYGAIALNSDGMREFRFKNTGKEPLLISSATPSCSCTVPDFSKDPIKPGEKGVIKVRYNGVSHAGSFEKTVTVVSNSKGGNVILRIKGTVK